MIIPAFADMRPPGPLGYRVTGALPMFRADPLGYLLSMARTYGDVVFYRFAGRPVYQFNHPDAMRELLVTQADVFPKSAMDRRILGTVLGNGLLLAEGDTHRQHRRLVAPSFHTSRMPQYAATIVAEAEAMVGAWRDDQTVSVAHAMHTLAQRIISRLLFGTTVAESADALAQTLRVAQTIATEGYRSIILPPAWLPLPQNLHVRRIRATIDGALLPIIRERAASGTDHGDLLSMLLLARDEHGQGLSEQEVRDEVVTLFIAGHETTANALCWALYLLSQHPEQESRLHAEVDAALADGASLGTETLAALPFTDQVAKETLRLFPSAWALSGRTATANTIIMGWRVKRGSQFVLSPYVLHRDERFFADAEQFRPARWTPAFEEGLPKLAYMPFGGGARVCIGARLATLELRLVLAAIARRARLRLPLGTTVTPVPLVTLGVDGPLEMRVTLRQPKAEPAL